LNGVSTALTTKPAKNDAPIYMLAALAGIGAGCADVVFNDLLLTALLVLAGCMLLGLLRPHWPWRWIMVVGAAIPLTELAFYLLHIHTAEPTRGQIYGSFLASLPGIAGAYGGSFLRTVVENLRSGK
jgi:hypothetical protein